MEPSGEKKNHRRHSKDETEVAVDGEMHHRRRRSSHGEKRNRRRSSTEPNESK